MHIGVEDIEGVPDLLTSMTYWPVSPGLKGLVDDVYVMRVTGQAYRGLAGALLPQVEWVLSGQLAWETRDLGRQAMPRAGALGPSRAAYRLDTLGDTVVVGCGLYPEGWATLMPIAAGTVSERVVPLADLWGPAAQALLALDPAQPDDVLAAAVDRHLVGRLADAPPADPRIAAISRWADQDAHDLAALTARLGISHRQLQRLTLAAHGLPPRQLANKHKILRMAAVLALGQYDNRRDTWTQEYFDQAHFIHHFKRFIGTTPTRFLRDPDLLVRDVMRARFAINSSHPLGLSATGQRAAGPG